VSKFWTTLLKIGSVVKGGASLFTPANILSIISLVKDLIKFFKAANDKVLDYKLKSYHAEKAALEKALDEAIKNQNSAEISRLHSELVNLERLWKQQSNNDSKDN